MSQAEVDFASLGPGVGARFPNATLVNQHGQPVNIHADRNGRPAIVVFHRSARW